MFTVQLRGARLGGGGNVGLKDMKDSTLLEAGLLYYKEDECWSLI